MAATSDDIAEWETTLAEALVVTGGPLTNEERAWADALLGARTSRTP